MLMVLSILLLGLSWAVAQDTSSPSGQSTGSSAQTSGAASGSQTVEGCLNGSSGNFTLTDKNGTSYQLTGDTSSLTEHVGHEVKITGTSGSASSGASSSSAGASGSSGQSLQVSSVKMVSKTCKSGSGMSH
jgi:hypothetical protein